VRSIPRTLLVVALCAAAAGAFVWLRPARVKPQISFLVIVVDSMRADHLPSYGYPRPTAPRIDRLGHDGLVFENAFAQAPWTKPSVASLFTSTYMSVHRVVYSKQVIDGQERTDVLNPKFLTLAEALKSGGFATAGFGMKIHLQPQFGFDQGFDAYNMHARRAEKVNHRALEWLRGADPDRFFMYLHYNDPHYPYEPRPGYARFGSTSARVQIDGPAKTAFREGRLKLSPQDIRQLEDLYDGEILYTDQYIGELIDAVGARGYKNLLVVVTADHGEEFLDHGGITHGQSLYEELVRVPLIVGGSGLPPAARGGRPPAHVELIDIMPTLLQIAGLPEPPGLQGRGLRPILGADNQPGDDEPVFTERRTPADTDFWNAVIYGRWKLIHDPTAGRTTLFDIEADPGETLPLEERNPEVVSSLRARIAAWMERNRILYEKIRPEDSAPLDPETEQRLRSLGYVD
jgi:arylsulfatase A-like enzyme